MAPKQPTDISAFLARGGTVTRCAPAEANATPLRVLRERAERNADAGNGYTAGSSRCHCGDATVGSVRSTGERLCEYHLNERIGETRDSSFVAWDRLN